MELTKEQKQQIKEWEISNWLLAAILQKESVSYEHYLCEVLECLYIENHRK